MPRRARLHTADSANHYCPPIRHSQPGDPESFGKRRKALGVLEMDGISVRGWHLHQDALILLWTEGIVNNNVVILLLFGESTTLDTPALLAVTSLAPRRQSGLRTPHHQPSSVTTRDRPKTIAR
jgi:hypothetical protein